MATNSEAGPGASRPDARVEAPRPAVAPPSPSPQLPDIPGFLDSIVDNIPHMIFVKEAAGLRFTRVNRAFAEAVGSSRERLLGQTDHDLFPPDQATAFQANDREALRGTAVLDVPAEPIDVPAGRRWLHTKKMALLGADGRPAFLLGISEDITGQRALADDVRRARDELEQRVLERTALLTRANEELQREIRERQQAEAALLASQDQLRQAQKMEAIGRLAGGVAHDFNNLLSVIVGYSQVLAAELPKDVPGREFVAEIHTAGLRAAELTKQLLAFGRKQVLVPRVLDLNEAIQDMARMLKRIIGEDIELRLVPAADLALTRLDPTQVEQIVMNLIVNARDAMPQGGKLTIETRNVNVDEDFARAHLGVEPGLFVMLAVTDTGTGMDAGTQARIFEPFFTTKGQGTGLGLATVFGIVQQSGGTIWVYSEVGRGTTFKIYFRATRDEETHPPEPSLRAPSRGSETILLVEDEQQVRGLLRNLLRRQGYEVLEAENGPAALEVAAHHEGEIHLVLSDVVMPKMSGPELVARLVEQRPALKVIYMSGYTDNAMLHHGALTPGVAFLHKPVGLDSLSRTLRDVLEVQADARSSEPRIPIR